jgi:hypothetical protein
VAKTAADVLLQSASAGDPPPPITTATAYRGIADRLSSCFGSCYIVGRSPHRIAERSSATQTPASRALLLMLIPPRPPPATKTLDDSRHHASTNTHYEHDYVMLLLPVGRSNGRRIGSADSDIATPREKTRV